LILFSGNVITMTMKNSILLIHPPVAKPCEPPPGIAKLQGYLKHNGINSGLLDLNLEGLLYLINTPCMPSDNWTKRAFRNVFKNINLLKSRKGYRNIDTYKNAVGDLNRLLKNNSRSFGTDLSLGNYGDPFLLPVRSKDLIKAAEMPEKNPFYEYFEKRLSDLLERENYHYAGISINYLNQALTAFSIIGFLRRKFPALKIIPGGGLVTSWMRRPGWNNPFSDLTDYLVDGPGEHRLLEILGKGKSNSHCIPDYSSLPLSDYLSPGFILPYSASTGCYWNRCSFCPEEAEGNPFIPVAPEKVIEDISILSEALKPSLIHFLDNAMSPALLQRIILNPLKIPWYGYVRFTPHLLEKDFCRKLKESGCVMLKLGLESGSQKVLESMNKGIDLDTVSSVLFTLKDSGIATYIYLLFGTPEENLLEARKTLDFTVKHSETINYLNLSIFTMPVYGKIREDLKVKDFYEGDLSLYTDFVHPHGWGRKEIRHFLEKEFKKHPAISSIVKRNLPVFTSNHAPFFVMDL